MSNKRNAIFTIGAFCSPREIQTKDGERYWCWVVDEFMDESYKGGKVFNPPEWSDTLKGLLVNTTAEEE
jgi:hypothetical protein